MDMDIEYHGWTRSQLALFNGYGILWMETDMDMDMDTDMDMDI